MEIRKSKPPKHTPELLQKAKAAVQSAFFGIRDAISAQRKKCSKSLCQSQNQKANLFRPWRIK